LRRKEGLFAAQKRKPAETSLFLAKKKLLVRVVYILKVYS